MRFPNKDTVERIRRDYPAGTRVKLVRMDDAQAPLAGTLGQMEVKGLSSEQALIEAFYAIKNH